MKTKHIETVFRAAATPAAKLAAWQNKSISRRRAEIQARRVKPYYAGETLATSRLALIAAEGPELSSPEAENPLLWVSERSPEVLATYAGRDFLNHRGWYTEDDGLSGETLETYAVQLARFPRLMFYAVVDSMNGDLRVMLEDWEEIDYSDACSDYQAGDCIAEAARQVVRSNDSSTEREAEESREYYRKDQAERDIAENRETLAALRSEIRDLCRELKALCPSPLAGTYPAAAKAIRRALGDLLADRRRLMGENETLAASI
jgi:hypothetical protein